MSNISFFYEGCKKPSFFSSRRINTWIKQVVSGYSFQVGEISFIFSTDDYLLDINRRYLNHDYFTDVITFDYSEDNVLSGDIFISLDTVKDNAEQYGVSFQEELNRVIIHGILHLAGFKDKTETEAGLMREAENSALNQLEKPTT